VLYCFEGAFVQAEAPFLLWRFEKLHYRVLPFGLIQGLFRVHSGMIHHERIVINPEIRFGRPCVKGTRISVGDVLGWLAAGMSETDIIADFPELTTVDIRACLQWAAEKETRTLIAS
jgi:uncharacterized protein (DUF433 family)